tara:strand:+ start:1367 stop:2563 length:1197 start_codon:yes stop_codon:yes gene_type:complete
VESYANLNEASSPTTLFTLLLSFVPVTFHMHLLLVQLGLMLLSLYLLDCVLSELTIRERSLALLLFLISPIALYLTSTITPYLLALTLSLAFILAYEKQHYFLSFLIAVVLPFVHLFSAILLFLYGLFLLSQEKSASKKKATIFLIGILVVFILLVSGVSISLKTEESLSPSFFISEFGAVQGYSFLFLFIGLIGLILSWKKTDLRYPLLLVLLFLSVINFATRIFVLIALSVFAAKALDRIIRRRWQVAYVKGLTLLLIFCTLLFSTLTQIRIEVDHTPVREDLQAYSFLNQQAFRDEQVFTHPSNQEYLFYYTGLSTPEELLTSPEELLSSFKLDNAVYLLEQDRIKYVYLDTATKKSWNIEESGLYFLLMNSGRFIRIYQLNSTEIYMYLGQEQS